MLHTTNFAALLAVAALAAVPACKFPYPADVPDEDASSCPFGFNAAEDRCADLDPSNGLATYLDQARAAAAIVLTDDAYIDTDAATLMVGGLPQSIVTAVVKSAPVDILVIMAGSFEARDLTVYGSRAVALVSDGDVRLRGHVSLSARPAIAGTAPGVPGAGSSPETDPSCTARRGSSDMAGHAGAGGGGHGTVGGAGGRGNGLAGGHRGEAVGTDRLVPLRGGCAGALAWGMSGDGASPAAGQGGGAIQISTRGRIVLDASATISANGSGAAGVGRLCPVSTSDPPACYAGSGGGAGGGILLEATTVDMDGSAALTANGGGGDCQYNDQAESGGRTEAPAAGQDCAMLTGAGRGGNGGAVGLAGTDGTDGTIGGGGGGGGAGRIRINLPNGVAFDPALPIVSPTPSLGRVTLR